MVIDAGAHHVLSRRESGGRLLAAGVLAVIGSFAGGQAVRVVIRRRKRGPKFAVTTAVSAFGHGDENVAVATVESGGHHNLPHRVGHHYPLLHLHPRRQGTDDSQADTSSSVSTPHSPRLDPISSLTSSVASLEPLSRSASDKDLRNTLARTAAETSALLAERIEQEAVERTPKVKTVEMEATDTVVPEGPGAKESAEDEAWEDVEVGRGLANYNSDEISKVKGTKRCVPLIDWNGMDEY